MSTLKDAIIVDDVERMLVFLENIGIDGGIIPSKFGYPLTPLMLASKHGSIKCLRILLSRGTSIRDNNVHSSFHLAALHGNAECLQEFIKYGVDLNMMDIYEFTALHYAVINGQIECVNILIRAGADINCARSTFSTPLLYAIDNRRDDCVLALINAGCDLYVGGHMGILHHVIGYEFGIKALLAAGVSIDNTVYKNNHPLCWALCGGHIESARLLMGMWNEEVAIKTLEELSLSSNKSCLSFVLENCTADIIIAHYKDFDTTECGCGCGYNCEYKIADVDHICSCKCGYKIGIVNMAIFKKIHTGIPWFIVVDITSLI